MRPARSSAPHRVHHQAVPRDHFGQVAVAVDRRLPGIARAVEVAAVDHVDAARGQRLAEAGDAQGLRAQPRAAVAGADVGGRADDRR